MGSTCSLDIVLKGKISALSTKEALIFQPSLVWLSQCLLLYCYSTVACGHLDYESILYEVSGHLECDINMMGEWFTKF
jgi:hypothetical protein